jgi:SAM-dependent methyltransferase
MARDITAEVAALYEEYPYPAHGVISRVIAAMLEEPVRRRSRAMGRRLRVLDAGCGTGEQTIGVARAMPELEVIGVDLNRASLDLASRLAARARVPVRFERRNLMEPLDDLGPFDVIVSVGVLHSLAEPRAGFEHLRRASAPHAAFLGMVYGAYGKWDSNQIRDALRLVCGEGAPRREVLEVLATSRLARNTGPLHALETLAQRARFGPRIPLLEAVRRALSGRNPAFQADTYTHVQEVVYTWAEVARLLEETGFRFEGWPRKSGMPDAPEQLFRGRALELVRAKPLLEQAAIYERLVRPICLYFLASAA